MSSGRTSLSRSALLFLLVLVVMLSNVVWAEEAWNPPFPRLAIWWPDPSRASLRQKIARYDWVGVSADEISVVVEKVKPLNPSLHVVQAVNFTEAQALEEETPAARDVRNLPAEFFLTQVGSTLREAVGGTSRTIKVAETRLPNGKARFKAGDYLICEGETMAVSRVDYRRNVLTVQRGRYRRAAPHAQGVRIAAAISFWPGTLVMNLSTSCPRVLMDPARTPETWAEYVVRVAGGVTEGVDAVLVDRADGNQSWLVGEYARSIDARGDNTFVTDYADFDQAWNDGLRALLQLLQEKSPTIPFFSNNGYPVYESLHGSVLEDVLYYEGDPPRQSRWESTVLGPAEEGGSYLQWLSNGQQPNYTLWECYEDHRGPDALDGDLDSYNNPAQQRGFAPNYRQMRFGLTTALLGDGFFSYEISTFVHGGRWLMWFDEYDNGGKGRGYLGWPLGALQVALRDTKQNAVIYRRDYDHGIVLVNPTAKARTITLETAYRSLRGRQQPQVNTGRLVRRLSIPARDGRILLRP